MTNETSALLGAPGLEYEKYTNSRPDPGDGLSASEKDESSENHESKSTALQTFLHLLKGYMGAGCLSLPWAVTKLGVIWGPVAIIVVSIWSSYNCWSIVRIKRYIEVHTNYDKSGGVETTSAVSSSARSSAATSLTYPEVGDWAYGAHFQTFVAICVCTQQLAICTVFFSFVGENLQAVAEWLEVDSFWASHVGVMTMTFPLILSLSLIPNLKLLSPVMALGTILLMVAFAAIGVVISEQWSSRPIIEELPSFKPSQAPLAISAILYSYEGINLILPVESNMKDPRKFKPAFLSAMALVALILVGFSVICVVTFGDVTSGSVTAFLLETLKDNRMTWWLMVANTAVSLSVLLTYPLQLFPALQLLGPSFSRYHLIECKNVKDSPEDDNDLSGFDPLPPLPEHGFPSLESLPDAEHLYEDRKEEYFDADAATKRPESMSSWVSASVATLCQLTMPGDSIQLRVFLVLMTYLVAVVVPNVQALISLAGALAGSSSALLIPPFLDLAWLTHLDMEESTNAPLGSLETRDEVETSSEISGSQQSPHLMRSLLKLEGKRLFSKLQCLLLIFWGLIFFFVGTYTAISDIVKSYHASP